MLAILKTFLLWMFGALSLALPELVKRVLGFLGFGLVTMTGLGYVEGLLVSQFTAQLSGVPSMLLSFIGIMKIDKAFSLLISAYGAKKLISGWSSSGTKSAYVKTSPNP